MLHVSTQSWSLFIKCFASQLCVLLKQLATCINKLLVFMKGALKFQAFSLKEVSSIAGVESRLSPHD